MIEDLDEGDEVIIYRKVNGVADPESVRMGVIRGATHGMMRIAFEPYEPICLTLIGLFHLDHEAENYKRLYGDTGKPVQVYFAELDEEIF